nr:O-antigen ligase family protein [Hyphomicrobiales bacterium]
GVPLYLLFIGWLSQIGPRAARVFQALFIPLVLLSAGVFLFEVLTQYSLTVAGDPEVTPENLKFYKSRIEANISHGISVIFLMAGPVTMYLLQKKSTAPLALALFATLVLIAIIFSHAATIIALIFAALVFLLCQKSPRMAFACVIGAAMLLITAGPLLGWMASGMAAETKAGLPFSWEWRVESWAYIYENLLPLTLWGHGFDSLRAVTETTNLRGFEDLPIVPMHAHNIGLHIWYETGLIGVILANIILGLSARAIWRSNIPAPRIAVFAMIGAVALTYSALSYSPWSDWWLGAICFAFGAAQLVGRTKAPL